jgi:hypothetical protein
MVVATLADLTGVRGFEVLEHLEAEAEVPVLAGIQFQGDVAVIPAAELPDVGYGGFVAVGPAGVEVVRGENGGHTHLLVGDAGAVGWCPEVSDPEGLAVGVADVATEAFLIHAEHGGMGLAAGRYVIRRQREQADQERRLVAD